MIEKVKNSKYDEGTLLAAYKAVKEEKRKMEEERRKLITKKDEISNEEREELLDENEATIRGLNRALNAIRGLGK